LSATTRGLLAMRVTAFSLNTARASTTCSYRRVFGPHFVNAPETLVERLLNAR
jgi:hypothetical protein